ncbi:hypothetical protein BGX20_006264 [Mortierella sp. AD010]|nr:hypothetical protein BGX20_006264 [Mortierella sp. AD010]
MTVLLKLFCLVNGRTTSDAFSIPIPSTQTVDDLKNLIYAHPRLGIAADEPIDLWKVAIPDTDDNEDIPMHLDDLIEKKKLRPTTDLSEVFGEGAPRNTIHIIVRQITFMLLKVNNYSYLRRQVVHVHRSPVSAISRSFSI